MLCVITFGVVMLSGVLLIVLMPSFVMMAGFLLNVVLT